MITDAYDYLDSKHKTRFAFQSEGVQGKVIKIIQFEKSKDGKWNLGFGDWRKGKIEDSIMTNNQDAIKVFRTVAKATFEFLNEYPTSIIVIEAVDDKRKRFYNLIFQRHFKELEPIFLIIGIIKKHKESYNPHKFYDSFEISLK
jgi:hypothetical protein